MALAETEPQRCPTCNRFFVVEFDDEDADVMEGNPAYCPRTPDGAEFTENVVGLTRCGGVLNLAVPSDNHSRPVG